MSALFEHGPGIIFRPVTLNRTLEIRDIPLIIPINSSTGQIDWNFYGEEFLMSLSYNVSNNWVFSATFKLALNQSQEPAWSKDGWAFAPINFNALKDLDLQHDLKESNQTDEGALANISLSTPALRGRIECNQPPASAFANLSNWLM